MLQRILQVVQYDVGNRGLARDPADNLITRTAGDFEAVCQSIARHESPRVAIITGFMIPSVDPPTGETDGPPGSLFLAEAFELLGIPVVLASDEAGYRALQFGVAQRNLITVSVVDLHSPTLRDDLGPITHLIALERSGPNFDGINCTMRGIDITPWTFPAHQLFEGTRSYVTIGIGDGGNEIGMGKIPRSVIGRNIPNGEQVASRTATDFLIVCGISNWGGYALAAGLMWLKDQKHPELFDESRELTFLEQLVNDAPLVDGVSGQFTPTVDGFDIAAKIHPMQQLRALIEERKISLL